MLGLLGSLLESSGGGGGGSPGGSNTQVQFNDAGSFGGDAGFTYNKTTDSLTLAGNQTFSGTAKRITGDFTNATKSNRLSLQTSTANSTTGVAALPSGTGQVGSFFAHGGSDADNSAYAQFHCDSSGGHVGINSSKTGTGTTLPIRLQIDNTTKVSVDTSGNLNYVNATASTAAAFDSSKNLVSVTNTGTGDNVLATSPTFTTSTTTAGTGGTVIQTLSSGASGGIYNTVIANYDFTSDATPVLIYTLTLATNTTYAIKGFVRGRRSGGGGSAGDSSVFNFFGCVKNVAGTVSIVSTIDVISKLDIAGPNITFSTSGATLQFYVTGVAATNINWSFFLETFGR